MKEVREFSLPEQNLTVTIGKFATQADGAVWLQQGGTVVLSTVVSSPTKDFPGFLPLSVDYKEHLAAAGKIPGGYLKREGRPSDKEVLVSRLIDRSLRPLFPTHYFDQVQVLSTVYSVDKEHSPYMLSLISSSLALCISKIPFLEPVGAVEAIRIDGKWIINPEFSQSLLSKVKITIAGTEEGISMVEGSSDEMSEEEFIDVLFLAHDHIKKQVKWQKKIQKEVGVPKEDVISNIDWKEWKGKVSEFLTDERLEKLHVADKIERSKAISELQKSFIKSVEDQAKDQEVSQTCLDYIFDQTLKQELAKDLFKENKRLDGRDFDQIRNISAQVGLLPNNHGSALFNRGKTQALVSAALGGKQDEQKIDTLMQGTLERSFMLHYNFPPFSVGEARSLRSPGRREIGHGYLARSAIEPVLPQQEEFPYTIRVVSDMLGSNGSSSMATVCGATLALMDAGVPISDMVSGIAMGLIRNNENEFHILSDIEGIEDAFGLMDFKVTGTEKGITAIQMDIKHKGGLTRDIFEKALAQAKKGRLHILGKMREVMTEPRAKLSALVPQVISFNIPSNKIGHVIGSGGKVIKDIIDRTDTYIDIEDDGTVKVFGKPESKVDLAIKWIKTISGNIEKGEIFEGKVKKIADFGIFVELAPGVDGLVHISNVPKEQQSNISKDFESKKPVTVEVIDYDRQTGRIRLKLVNNK